MTSSSTIAMVLCHGVCARADEPVPTEGSAVNEPAPASRTTAKQRERSKQQPVGGQGELP